MYNANALTQFKSSDFYISAYILSLGYKLTNIDKTNPRRAVFVFEDCAKGQELSSGFLLGKEKIEPKKFVSAIKELKQLLYSNY